MAFVPAPAGQQGDLGRNVLRGFGAWQAVLGLQRQFQLSERTAIRFRGEFFIVFNHPNFGSPNNILTSRCLANRHKPWPTAWLVATMPVLTLCIKSAVHGPSNPLSNCTSELQRDFNLLYIACLSGSATKGRRKSDSEKTDELIPPVLGGVIDRDNLTFRRVLMGQVGMGCDHPQE
jgi:hypothetical protein